MRRRRLIIVVGILLGMVLAAWLLMRGTVDPRLVGHWKQEGWAYGMRESSALEWRLSESGEFRFTKDGIASHSRWFVRRDELYIHPTSDDWLRETQSWVRASLRGATSSHWQHWKVIEVSSDRIVLADAWTDRPGQQIVLRRLPETMDNQ